MVLSVWPILLLSYLVDGRTIDQRDEGAPLNDTATFSSIDLNLVLEATPGPNVSRALQVVYYEDPDPQDQLQKRGQTSKPVNDCAPRHRFLYSRCSRFHGPQAWSLVCRAEDSRVPPGKGLTWGRCKDSELCVESRNAAEVYGEGYRYSMAYCVDLDNFKALAALLAGRYDDERPKRLKVSTAPHASFQAVITTPDSLDSVSAQHMELHAQMPMKLGNRPLWRTVDVERQQCDTCSNVEIPDVPNKAQSIQLDLAVNASVMAGKLYLASVGRSVPAK